ncbi:MAG: acyl-CoA thioesterase [Thermoanaerobaculia bacterium]
MTAPVRSHVDVEVRYAETDQMGVVHHAAYLVWFELARTHHCALTGRRYADIEGMGYWLMVTGVDLRYRRGARYGDTVRVACWIDELTSRTLRFSYEVTRDEQTLATGHSDHLWVRIRDRKPCRIPPELEPAFRALSPPS